MTFKLAIGIEPVAQGRPRFVANRGYIRAVDPPKSKAFKEAVRIAASGVVQKTLGRKLNAPLSLEVSIYRPIPKSFSNKQKKEAVEGRLLPSTKPDLDNYIKAILDALNGVVYEDDAGIVEITNAHKLYSERPGIFITIKEIENG